MSAESLIVTLADGTTDHTFYKQSQNGYSMRFADGANTAQNKLFLDFDHQIKPSGAVGTDTHTMTFRREAVDNDTQKLYVSKVSLQVTVPRTDAISTANIGNDMSCLMSLFKTTFFEPFVLGITTPGDYNVTGPFNPARA